MSRQVTRQDAEVALVANTPTVVIPAGGAQSTALVFNKDPAAVVYMTSDGSDPSADHGLPIGAGSGYEFPKDALPQAAVKVFSTGTPRVFSSWA